MISVLLPVYNEEANLLPLIDELLQVLRGIRQPFEIILVDDGSTDRSAGILQEQAARNAELKVILFRRNAGQTAAFDAGFRAASGDLIVTLDSDRQNDPHDIPRMLALVDEGYDLVAGWRKDRQDGLVLRKLPSRFGNWLIRRVTGTRIHDLGCSLKVYRREITDELRLYGEMHRFIGVLAENMGARVGEQVVHHRPRVAGESKYSLGRAFKVALDLITVWFMQRYRAKPIYVFGGAGALLIFLSACLAGYVLWDKWTNGVFVHRNPLFIVGVLFAIVGIQFVGLGILAELVIRTYFESSKQHPYSIAKTIGFGS